MVPMNEVGARLRDRRIRAGLTQRELARRSHLSQPAVAAFESGARRPSPESVERLDAALRVPPSTLLLRARPHLHQILAARGITHPRVFGSVARGEDTPESDLDLLVTVPEAFDIFDKAMLVEDLQNALGARVDVVPDHARGPVAERARKEAVPL
jgi:predicted nucleotidyltransferase/DNA-binding XRE family transcriptional regulator